MLGFTPLSGAPLADLGIRTLTLVANTGTVANNKKTVNMMRATFCSTSANVLRIIPKSITAVAVMVSNSALLHSFIVVITATTLISSSYTRTINKILGTTVLVSSSISKLVLMLRAATVISNGFCLASRIRNLTANVLSAIVALNKIPLKTMQSGTITSALMEKLLSKTLRASSVLMAKNTSLINKPTLIRRASAIFNSRTSDKQAESRIAKG